MLMRQQELIHFLLENTISTIDECCLYLQISKPTLRADIDVLNDYLRDFGVKIIKKDQELLFDDENNARKFVKVMNSFISLSLISKMQLILLLENKILTLQQIADFLYVSKSKAILIAGELIRLYPDLVNSSRYGYIFSANDAVRKEMFIKLLFPHFKGNDFIEEFDYFTKKQLDLYRYVSTDQLELLNLILRKIELEIGNIKEEVLIKLFLDGLFCLIENKQKLAADQVEKHLMKQLFYFLEDKLEYVDQKVVELKIEKGMKKIDRMIGTEFSCDYELKNNLLNHILLASHKNGEVEHSELLELRSAYPLSYEAAVSLAQLLEEELEISINSELALLYLTIHFQNSLEKKKKEMQKVRVLILTPYGEASGHLIENQLMQQFDEIEVVDIISKSNYLNNQEKYSYVDLILSLSYMESKQTNILYIPFSLREKNIQEIEKLIQSKKIRYEFEELIENGLFYDTSHIENVESAIRWVNQKLVEYQVVDERYLESMLEREKISSTAIKGLAVPHGRSEFVRKNQMLVVKTKKILSWGNHLVEWIFLLTLTEDTMKKNPTLFNQFYRTIVKKRFYIALQKNKDMKDLENNFKQIFLDGLLEEF